MKTRLATLLRCPFTDTALELVEWEGFDRPLDEQARARAGRLGIPVAELERQVQSGVLLSKAANVAFPIHDGVPRLLRFRAGVVEAFDRRWGERLRREHPGYRLPDGEAMPGEKDVLRTFSSEWVNYDWDGETYWNQSASAWFRSMDYVLDLAPRSLDGKRVLEIGIGIGGVVDHVSRTHDAEVVGMDLGYAVDAAHRHFGDNPFLHIVQASAFHPPYAKESFDFVYSFGVIHHTFSTKQAFDSVARLPKPGGRLFIWVYSDENERRSLLRRVLMGVETVARPFITKLPEQAQTLALIPTVPVYMGHQLVQQALGKADARYGFREALHAARDRLTPKFAHRHSEDEVESWFRETRYNDVRRGSSRVKPEWLPVGFLKNTAVDGVRARG